jgi:ABC-type uncharacterized transport system permease subunit
VLEQVLLLVAQSILISVPLVLAALGGVCSERAGVVNIALEGVLLVGAFAAAVTAHASGSAVVGVMGGVMAGLLVSMLHALLTIAAGANQIISGLAINLLVAGATDYGAKSYWPADASRALPPIPYYRWSDISVVDTLTGRPLVLLTALLVVLTALFLGRTVLGLRLSAVGESPAACETRGLSVARLRTLGVALSGVLAGWAARGWRSTWGSSRTACRPARATSPWPRWCSGAGGRWAPPWPAWCSGPARPWRRRSSAGRCRCRASWCRPCPTS